jgi:hypothetical protein
MSWIKLNATTPAAPARKRNVHFRWDTAHAGTQSDPIPTSAYFDIVAGGVNAQTGTSYELVAEDSGQVLTLANADPIAVTLPDPATLPEDFWLLVKNLGAGLATLTPTDSTIDGEASLDLDPGAWMAIFRDGAAYISLQPGGGAGGSAHSISDIDIDDAIPPADGQIIQYSEATGKWEFVTDRPVHLISAVPGKPAAGQLVLIYTPGETQAFPGNFASPNSQGSIGVNPTATATYTAYKNGSPIGTVVISTGGAFIFATTSGLGFTLTPPDRFTVVAPGSQDATLSDVVMNFVGTRAATVSGAVSQQIFVFRGIYNGGTSYNANDVTSYQGGLYVCILPSTGNVPTNGTYWTVMLGYTWTFRGAYAGGTAYVPNDVVTSAGSCYLCTAATTGNAPPNGTYWAEIAAAGSVSAAQVQQEALTYSADSGAADAYAVTLSPAPTIVAGSVIQFKVAHANTGASTLAVNSAAPVAIKKSGGTALASGDIAAGQIVLVVFDGTYWETVGGGGGGGDLTAKYIIGAADALLANARVWPGLFNSPDAPPASPGSLDDEFDAGSLDTGRWTWQNQGGASAVVAKSYLALICPGTAGEQVRAITQTAPAPTWEVTAKVSNISRRFDYSQCGLVLMDAAGKLIGFGYLRATTEQLGLSKWNSVTSFSGAYLDEAFSWPPYIYLRVKDDNVNLTFSFSYDGVRFEQWYQVSRTNFFASGPTKVGLFGEPANASIGNSLSSDWFRRTL